MRFYSDQIDSNRFGGNCKIHRDTTTTSRRTERRREKTERKRALLCSKSRGIDERTGRIAGTRPGCIFKWAPMLAAVSPCQKELSISVLYKPWMIIANRGTFRLMESDSLTSSTSKNPTIAALHCPISGSIFFSFFLIIREHSRPRRHAIHTQTSTGIPPSRIDVYRIRNEKRQLLRGWENAAGEKCARARREISAWDAGFTVSWQHPSW